MISVSTISQIPQYKQMYKKKIDKMDFVEIKSAF